MPNAIYKRTYIHNQDIIIYWNDPVILLEFTYAKKQKNDNDDVTFAAKGKFSKMSNTHGQQIAIIYNAFICLLVC